MSSQQTLTITQETASTYTFFYETPICVDAEDDPNPEAFCTPASGSTVSVGVTTVICTCTDSNNVTVFCTSG